MQKEQIKTLLVNVSIAAVVVGITVFGYIMFKNISSGSASNLSAISQSTTEIAAEISRTENILKDLSTDVKYSAIFFKLPSFESLEKFSVDIPKVAVGRENPFLPTQWKLDNIKKENEAKGKTGEEAKETKQAVGVSAPASAGDSQQSALFGDFSAFAQ